MNMRANEGYRALTEKEKQTLRLIVRGHDAKSVARSLDLSVHTINDRLRDARRKMAVSSSREAARMLLQAEGVNLDPTIPDLLAHTQIGAATPADMKDQETAPIDGAGRTHRRPWIMMGALLMTLMLGLLVLTTLPQPASLSPSAPDAMTNRFVFVGNRDFSTTQLTQALARSDDAANGVDAELQLRRFYFAQGYADFRIVSATTDPGRVPQDSVTTFVIDEGVRYKFGEISVLSTLPEFDGPTLARKLPEKQGNWYDARMTRATMDWLNTALRQRNAAATVEFRRDPAMQTMSVTFIIANRAPGSKAQ